MAPSTVPLELQFGRKLRAHIARELHERTCAGIRFQLIADGPVRLREVIGDAEAHGERQAERRAPSSIPLELLRDEIEPAANIERPSPLPFGRAADPNGVCLRY